MSWTMFFNVFASLLLSSQAFYCQVASVVNIIIYWFQVALSPAALQSSDCLHCYAENITLEYISTSYSL